MKTASIESDNSARTKQIKDFWAWFASNSDQLQQMYSNRDFEGLGEHMNVELDKINRELAWEIGPGINKEFLLTISSEGNASVRKLVDRIIKFAPRLAEWEFHFSRPPRPPAGRIRLPERNLEFDTNLWKFTPIERPAKGRLDLIILDEHLASADHEAALKAVSIYLDELLGEDAVEAWIGEFKVTSPAVLLGQKVHDITEIRDYLYWATHRQVNPLKRR